MKEVKQTPPTEESTSTPVAKDTEARIPAKGSWSEQKAKLKSLYPTLTEIAGPLITFTPINKPNTK